jgi:prophage DNA circulation protein
MEKGGKSMDEEGSKSTLDQIARDISETRREFFGISRGLSALLDAIENLTNITSAVHAAVSTPTGPSPLVDMIEHLVAAVGAQTTALSSISAALIDRGSGGDEVAAAWEDWFLKLRAEWPSLLSDQGEVAEWRDVLPLNPTPKSTPPR